MMYKEFDVTNFPRVNTTIKDISDRDVLTLQTLAMPAKRAVAGLLAVPESPGQYNWEVRGFAISQDAQGGYELPIGPASDVDRILGAGAIARLVEFQPTAYEAGGLLVARVIDAQQVSIGLRSSQ